SEVQNAGCECGREINVIVECKTNTCLPAQWSKKIQCCPEITVAVQMGKCTDDGRTPVIFTAQNLGPVGASGSWDFDPGNTLQLPVGAAVPSQHLYPPGSYAATLTVPGCPAVSVRVEVPHCGPDPHRHPTHQDLMRKLGCLTMGIGCSCGMFCCLWVILLAGYLFGIATGALASATLFVLATAVLVAVGFLYLKHCGMCALAECTHRALAVYALAVIVSVLLFSLVLPGLVQSLLVAVALLVVSLAVRRRYCGNVCGTFCFLWVVLLAGFLFGIATGALASATLLFVAVAALGAFAMLYQKDCGTCALAKCTLRALAAFAVALAASFLNVGLVLPGLAQSLTVAFVLLIVALWVRRRFCP
ncbi:MAG TPA: hypothetical protein VGX50_14025, partial [Longimicrobium sp.]|nr:hypothetical protein [Longimicrobium sp.]